MDTAEWPQIIGVEKTVEKKPRPQKEQALNCPRCSSTNTKFCYYNNYSLSQPRFFCKTCRRYWTEGGSLRNVPVGGGSRKNKRSSSSSSSSSSAILSSNNKVNIPDNLSPPKFSSPQNPKIHEGQDLNLAYNPSHYNIGMSEFVSLPFGLENKNNLNPQNPNFPNTASSHDQLPVMEFFKTGDIIGSNSVYTSSGFPALHDFKPSLGFTVDGLENGYGNLQGVEDHANNSSRNILFPFGELKQASNSDQQFEQDRGQGETNGFWNGMLAGGPSW